MQEWILRKPGNEEKWKSQEISEERLDDVAEKLGVKEKLVDLASHEARVVEIDLRLGKELSSREKKEKGKEEKKKEEK
jgi:hypothetical protein